jgi:hypothetical protein
MAVELLSSYRKEEPAVGYTGAGYEGGYWRDGNFFYNRTVNNISSVSITNVYNKTVVVNTTSAVTSTLDMPLQPAKCSEGPTRDIE